MNPRRQQRCDLLERQRIPAVLSAPQSFTGRVVTDPATHAPEIQTQSRTGYRIGVTLLTVNVSSKEETPLLAVLKKAGRKGAALYSYSKKENCSS